MGLGQSAVEDLELNPRFWRARRVLLTGHTGFKGAWTTLWLHSMGAAVTGYALRPPTDPSLYDLAGVRACLAGSIEADVRDRARLQRAFDSARPEVVIHLAGQSLVRESYADPVRTYETNVIGTLNVLEAARACESVRALVVATSDKCYVNDDSSRPHREGDALGGRDPYSSSKACAELVVSAYRESFFAAPAPGLVATVRAGNVIGGGDFAPDRLVPDVVRAIQAGRAVQVRNPDAVRPWQHVLDPLYGYLGLAERLYAGERECAQAWNFGPDDEAMHPASRVVERALEAFGSDVGWQADRDAHPYETATLTLCSAKARERLGWRPRLGLEAAIGWTMLWYRAHDRGGDVGAEARGQIARYSQRVAQ